MIFDSFSSVILMISLYFVSSEADDVEEMGCEPSKSVGCDAPKDAGDCKPPKGVG